jgi:coenzyme F420-reducing hydrogenase alpha subunit
MEKVITVNPVTRVEGHGAIRLIQDEKGNIADAQFSVQEFRGFEKFCEGAPAERLPLLTSRICGICPVSHHLASVKAIEDCFKTKITPTAVKMRELMALGQVIESHMLSLAVLSIPDLMSVNTNPEKRNIFGLYELDKDMVNKALALRSFGTAVYRTTGRRDGHPIGSRIGGVVKPLSQKEQGELLGMASELDGHVQWFASTMRTLVEKNRETIDKLGDITTAYMSMTKNDTLTFYDGTIRVIGSSGEAIHDFTAHEYFNYVEEAARNWSYMKFPVLKSKKNFRVGPLARVNIAEDIPTPLAKKELAWFRETMSRPAHKTLSYHVARYIEVVYAFERARELLSDPDIVKADVFCSATVREGTGVGIVEAPRGTLVHKYDLDKNGRVTKLDMYVATQHNNFGFNDSLKETASKMIKGSEPDEATLNSLEMIVRAYDPCLSCATHTINKRSFKIEILDCNGHVVKEW